MSDTKQRLHNFELSSFKQAQQAMIATSDNAYSTRYGWQNSQMSNGNYTIEQVQRIVDSGTIAEQRALSRHYFAKDGYYKQLILHYATLLKYTGILIPNPTAGKSLSTSHIQKKYYQAIDYVEKMSLPTLCVEWARKILINGCYYGVINKVDKNTFSIIDLPTEYCTTRFKDFQGNDIVEFDVSYFRSIHDKDMLKAALAAYPDFIVKAYHKWDNGKLKSKWVIIPADIGICFPMFELRPFFLSVIPATIQYDEAVETEQEREREEIRRILVQKIPHLSDGRLLFEPPEAVEIHQGAVGMVRNNKNTTVLTTYTDVDSIASKGSNESSHIALEQMQKNIYSKAGVSGELFAASGGNTTETSIKFDMAVMMYLGNQFAKFVTNIVNLNFSNSNITFKYSILPITYHNESKYIDGNYKLATSGYSLIIPALAQGLSQRDLVNLKDLENKVLGLGNKLIPPKTSFNSGSDTIDNTGGDEEQGGRPTKETDEKKDQTLRNEESIEKSQTQGGSE